MSTRSSEYYAELSSLKLGYDVHHLFRLNFDNLVTPFDNLVTPCKPYQVEGVRI